MQSGEREREKQREREKKKRSSFEQTRRGNVTNTPLYFIINAMFPQALDLLGTHKCCCLAIERVKKKKIRGSNNEMNCFRTMSTVVASGSMSLFYADV